MQILHRYKSLRPTLMTFCPGCGKGNLTLNKQFNFEIPQTNSQNDAITNSNTNRVVELKKENKKFGKQQTLF